ncbi:potassium/proton antiporter [Pradoshia sp. D12]|uniref:potassium/proton antiporter n=1 Tax=Bacillaceae TaxID=186817 RepID=UPI001126ECDE|nr:MULTISPECIES: potassium/proton antiporter [Bacillaceae]QFK73270.1 potassium/proton antiporter [Pradoshia sp. D12]TPF73810.1 potassium/proton antiporter [Bacillus sp. D12]
MPSEVLTTDFYILIAAILLILGILSTKFSAKLGVPSLVFFILVGMAMGNDTFGVINFSNAGLAQTIGVLALIIILFEGGIQTKWKSLRPIILPSLSLATIGVLITSAIVTIAAHYILNVDWLIAMLFGSIVGSTDAAAVFAVLKGQNIQDHSGKTLEAESGSNDPMAIFLTVSCIEMITSSEVNVVNLIGSFIVQMGLGLLLGWIFGKIAVAVLNRINLESTGLYPVFAVTFALLTYGITANLNGSGLLAVYVMAIIIGNSEVAYEKATQFFAEGFAWMMQILMFIILGLLVNPDDLFSLEIILKGLLLSVILILIARPAAVFISTIKMNFNFKERVFLSWAGLKGSVPIVLATFPLLANIGDSHLIFNVVFFVVLTSCLIQGSTISFVAGKLGLAEPASETPKHSLEIVSLGKANAEMVKYQMEPDSFLIGKTLIEIPFPDHTLVNAIIRDDKLVTPTGDTVIKEGDFLYVLTPKLKKRSVKQLLRKKNTDNEE